MGISEGDVPEDERINPRKLSDSELRTELEKRNKVTTGTRAALYQRLDVALEEDRKARIVPRPHYSTMGPTMLDKDYVDVETRRAGIEWKSSHNIVARLKPFVTKKVEDDFVMEEEIDDVEREELLMAYNPDKDIIANYILTMLIAGVAAEEAKNTADEELRHSFDTWWPETLGARLTFAQDFHSQEVAKDAKKEGKSRVGIKMPKIKAQAGFGKRQQDFAYEMRRSQASWKGFSTLDPGGAYGVIDPFFSQSTKANHKEIKKARKQEKKLRKIAATPRLKALSSAESAKQKEKDALRRKLERDKKKREKEKVKEESEGEGNSAITSTEEEPKLKSDAEADDDSKADEEHASKPPPSSKEPAPAEAVTEVATT
jgi:hypothetical protein